MQMWYHGGYNRCCVVNLKHGWLKAAGSRTPGAFRQQGRQLVHGTLTAAEWLADVRPLVPPAEGSPDLLQEPLVSACLCNPLGKRKPINPFTTYLRMCTAHWRCSAECLGPPREAGPDAHCTSSLRQTRTARQALTKRLHLNETA